MMHGMLHREARFNVLVSLSDRVSVSAREYVLAAPAWQPHPHLPDVFHVECTAECLRHLCHEWLTSMQPADADHIRCHVSAAGNEPPPSDLMHSRDLKWLINRLDGYWLGDLIRTSRLITYFQPIVELECRSRVFAFECLSRGQGTHGEIIPPDVLFKTARDTGQLAVLDRMAQVTAVRTAARKRIGAHVFINISPRCLDTDASAIEDTLAASLSAGLPTNKLIFEVVESDQLEHVDQLARVLDRCRHLGSRIALDDVGAGYSSLALMVEIRPDFIKIDRDLIRGIDQDLFKCRVVSKLIELARELDIATVIEGIETEAEWNWAVDQGAHYAQGFLLGKPTPEPGSTVVELPADLPVVAQRAVCDTIE